VCGHIKATLTLVSETVVIASHCCVASLRAILSQSGITAPLGKIALVIPILLLPRR